MMPTTVEWARMLLVIADIIALSILCNHSILASFTLKSLTFSTLEELAAQLRDTAFFFYFGRAKGFPYLPAFAMACGCCVVSYHGGGGREYMCPPLCYPVEEGDVLGDLLVSHEAPVEPAPLPAGEDLSGNLQSVEAGVSQARRPITEEVARQRHLILNHLA